MSNSVVKMNSPEANRERERAAPWTPLRDLLGFDPFHVLRASYGFDYDVSRTANGYDVEVPVPGYNSSQIDVSMKEGIVNVAGKNDRHSFTRSFTIPDDVDPDAITARVKDGMLVLSLQRRPEAEPKKIRVE